MEVKDPELEDGISDDDTSFVALSSHTLGLDIHVYHPCLVDVTLNWWIHVT